MLKSVIVTLSLLSSTTVFASSVCRTEDRSEIMRHYFGASVDLTSGPMQTYARQFRDQSNKIFPDPATIQSTRITIPKKMEIRGSTAMFGFYPGAYRYDVLNENGTAVIEVRVFLKDGSEAEHEHIKERVSFAEKIWNSQKPAYAFDYKFRFKIVASKDEALFSVHLKNNTRGPYFKNWDTDGWWTVQTQAHEIGHMMGLTDEYEGLSGESHCDQNSMWCSDGTTIQPFHYYQILRRVVMQASGCQTK